MEMQAEAERKKRAQILESEGNKTLPRSDMFVFRFNKTQILVCVYVYIYTHTYIILQVRSVILYFSGERQAHINIADGKKSSMMLEAQGKLATYKLSSISLDVFSR